MTLNVKNKEAYELARAISDATGESLTRVVIEALRARQQQIVEKRQRSSDELEARIHAIGQRAAGLIGDRLYLDHAEFLYDDKGLPK